VRAGKDLFLSAVNGSDWRNGSFQAPVEEYCFTPRTGCPPGDRDIYKRPVWRRILKTHFTAYLSNGSRWGGQQFRQAGRAPKALVGVSGARAGSRLAKAHGPGLWYFARPNIPAREDWWVISQLHIVGGKQAIDMGRHGMEDYWQ